MKFLISCMIQNISLEIFHSAGQTVKWLNVPSSGKQHISLDPTAPLINYFPWLYTFPKAAFIFKYVCYWNLIVQWKKTLEMKAAHLPM